MNIYSVPNLNIQISSTQVHLIINDFGSLSLALQMSVLLKSVLMEYLILSASVGEPSNSSLTRHGHNGFLPEKDNWWPIIISYL